MSSSFDAEEISRVSSRSFDEDYLRFDHHISSQTYGSFSAFAADENDKGHAQFSAEGVGFAHDESIPLSPDGYGYLSDRHPGFDSTASPFAMKDSNGSVYGGEVNGGGGFYSDGLILEPPSEMRPDEGGFLREWRRENIILLEEKESVEKEMRKHIISEAEAYKKAYHEKRKSNSESNKAQNREKEKLFLANHEKFHGSADKQCWKAIAELIPNEVPNLEKRGKKEQEKKPSLSVVQGPKPGKPTDLSRMRHLLLKLKHSTPPHLELNDKAPASASAETAAQEKLKAPALKEVEVVSG